MRQILIIMISILFFLSCAENNDSQESNTTRPETPNDKLIDINSDGINDFLITYYETQTYDDPSSFGSITGSFNPQNENQLLYNFPDGYLFLTLKDTIKSGNYGKLTWSKYPGDLISINRYDYIYWEENWKVISTRDSPYYLAFKLKSDTPEKIGWMKLEFDVTTGEITIADSQITDLQEIVIK